MTIRLIVGLGNPGPEYADTRHNAGFWAVDRFARLQTVSLRHERGFFADLGRSPKVMLLKPQTYMNRSGQAVKAVSQFYRVPPAEILVIHDELDLLPGTVKLKFGGGHAGHNGLKDIAQSLGTAEFWRARVGIGHPRTLNLNQAVADFVLHPPRRDEQGPIDEAIDRLLKVLDQAIAGDMAGATMTLHRS